jgi:hypothetical protein
MLRSRPMRVRFSYLAVPLAVLTSACKLLHEAGVDAGPEAAAAASSAPEAPSASEAPEASAPAPSTSAAAHVGPHAFGPPAPGNPCPAKDALACATDGFEELTCSGGAWHVLQTCRGPGGCKGEGAAVKCDPGAPRAGDACIVGSAVPRCEAGARSVLQCENGRWVSSLCLPPSKCQPNAKNGQPGCK